MTQELASPSSPPAPPAHSGGAATPDVQENRFAAIQHRLAEGYYQRPEVLEKLAEALSPELLPAP
jgi:hypothetical protein